MKFSRVNFGAACAAFVSFAFATATASATQPTAGAAGNVSIVNTNAGSMSVGSNGRSTSYAANSESSHASVTSTASYRPGYSAVNAGVSGSTKTTSAGMAYNVSSGSGTGGAVSQGSTGAGVGGAVGINSVTNGFNGGGSGTTSSNNIAAGANQGSYVSGQTLSGFTTQIHYDKAASSAPVAGYIGGTKNANVSISTLTNGYVSGANTSGALNGMNAAGIANIGAAGQFFTHTDLTGNIGTGVTP